MECFVCQKKRGVNSTRLESLTLNLFVWLLLETIILEQRNNAKEKRSLDLQKNTQGFILPVEMLK